MEVNKKYIIIDLVFTWDTEDDGDDDWRLSWRLSELFWMPIKNISSHIELSHDMGGIRKEITLLISSWLPFGQNELCSDGNKMHSNLFRSSENVGSFF